MTAATPHVVPAVISQALRQHRVLAQLTPATLDTLASQASLSQHIADTLVLAPGQLAEHLWLVVDGSVRLEDPEQGWQLTLQAGDWLGAGVSSPTAQQQAHVVAVTATELLALPLAAVVAACAGEPALASQLGALPPATPGHGLDRVHNDPAMNLLATPMHSLLKREPITAPPTATIREVATVMATQRASSVLLIEQGLLFGIVTDRDLRNRVVAQGLDIEHPVADIATLAPLTVQGRSPAFEALLLMARHNIHHLPVMDGQRILGMVTATDLTEQHSTSAVYLASDIYKQTTVEGLAAVSARVKRLQRHLAAADASAYSTGHIVTTITDALTTRLIHLAEAQLGPAPVDYVWVAAGSQARSEQTAKSDQDNCLVLDDAYNEAQHGDYFRAFSNYVCDGLDACGYIHCPGKMMAMTDEWRQPLARWRRYFRQWVEQPDPTALMLTCVFFDLRAVAGSSHLLESLRREVLSETRGNTLFLAHMVGNALKHRPPLGLFGQISPVRGGEHSGCIDLKHTGTVPIVDLARVYALAGGLETANTHDRLEQAAHAGEISEDNARDLRDALESLGKLRIAHQARQIERGVPPDNFLRLDELSNVERAHLKSAFGVVQQLQSVLGQRYQGGRF
jgi:CBS domain-containing protein